MEAEDKPGKFSFGDVVGMVLDQRNLFWKSLETWRASEVAGVRTAILIHGKSSYTVKVPLKYKQFPNFTLSDIKQDLLDYFKSNGCILKGSRRDGIYELWEFASAPANIGPYHSFLPVSYALDHVVEDIILDITGQIKRNVSMGFYQCMCTVPQVKKDHRHGWDLIIDTVIARMQKDRGFVLKKVPNEQFKLYWDFESNSDVAVSDQSYNL
jgi:hypothetical protein